MRMRVHERERGHVDACVVYVCDMYLSWCTGKGLAAHIQRRPLRFSFAYQQNAWQTRQSAIGKVPRFEIK